MTKAKLPEMNKAAATDWIATCGVCNEPFAIREEDLHSIGNYKAVNPYPNGCFCPNCQERKLIAPGILHWKQRGQT